MKAQDILIEYNAFVNLVDDFISKQQKASDGSSMHKHEATIAMRSVKTAIAKYRMTTHIAPVKSISKRPAGSGYLNFIAK